MSSLLQLLGVLRVRSSGTERLIPSYLPPGFLPLRAHAGQVGILVHVPCILPDALGGPPGPQLDLWEEAQRLSGRVHEQVLVSPGVKASGDEVVSKDHLQVRKCLV